MYTCADHISASCTYLLYDLQVSAQYALQRLQLELAAVVILTAYLPVAVWEFAQDLVHQLPSAAAALAAACTSPLHVAQRYMACLHAISTIGEEDARPLFPKENHHHQRQQQQQQQQQQQPAVPLTQNLLATAQYGLEWLLLEAAAAIILTAYLPIAVWEWVEEDFWPAAMAAVSEPWQAFWHWIECLDALSTQLDKDEEDGRPLYTRPPHHHPHPQPQPRPKHHQRSAPTPSRMQAALPYMAERVKLELAAAVILAAYLPMAVWEFTVELLVQLPAAVSAVVGFVSMAYRAGQKYIACLQAIAHIGEEDARPLFTYQHQQQSETTPGPSAAEAAGVTSGSFLHCLEAIGELGCGEANTPAAPHQQQKQLEGVVSPAAIRLSPLQAAKGLLTCMQAISQLDSSSDDSSSDCDDSSTLSLEQLTNLVGAKAPTPTAPAAPPSSPAAAAMSTASGLLGCLTAIGQLDSSDGPSEEELYALAANPQAPSAAAAAARWMSPVQAAKGFVASLTAIGELGSSGSRDSTALEQHSEEVGSDGVGAGAGSGWVSPVGMVREYSRSLQAIAELDGSDFQVY
jgi:Flp pilus assembly protein TadB